MPVASNVILAIVALSTRAGPPACQPYAYPAHLPALDRVLDSAALVTRLQSVAPTAAGEMSISLRWSTQPEGYLLGTAPHPPWHEAVLEQVLASLRPADRKSWLAVQVHVQTGASPAITLERSILCSPIAIEGQNVSPQFGTGRTTPFKPSPIPGAHPETVKAKSLISAGGVVTSMTIISSSGYPEIDRDIIQRSKAQRYAPAHLDGRPVAVWMLPDGIRVAP